MKLLAWSLLFVVLVTLLLWVDFRAHASRVHLIDIYSCDLQTEVSYRGLKLAKIPYRSSPNSAELSMNVASFHQYVTTPKQHWVTYNYDSNSLIYALSGLVNFSRSSGSNMPGRPISDEARRALVGNVLNLWQDFGIDVAGSYLVKAMQVFYNK